jgi:hypothetical protein
MLEGIPKSTIYDIIKRVDNGISLERQSGSGNPKKISQKIKDKIIYENVNEIGRSYRSIGCNHDIHHMTAKKVLDKAGVIVRDAKSFPRKSWRKKTKGGDQTALPTFFSAKTGQNI